MNGDFIIGMVVIGCVGDGGEVEGWNVVSVEEVCICESGDDFGGGEVVVIVFYCLFQEILEWV